MSTEKESEWPITRVCRCGGSLCDIIIAQNGIGYAVVCLNCKRRTDTSTYSKNVIEKWENGLAFNDNERKNLLNESQVFDKMKNQYNILFTSYCLNSKNEREYLINSEGDIIVRLKIPSESQYEYIYKTLYNGHNLNEAINIYNLV